MTQYHYTESGLENIYLHNGFTFHDTPYGQGVSIKNTAELHKAIGQWLIDFPKRLTGAEHRFLRLEMELTQRCMADLLGTTEQCVQRWERARGKGIPGPADRLLRALYREYVKGDGSVRSLVTRLAELDEIVGTPRAVLSNTRGWHLDRQEAG